MQGLGGGKACCGGGTEEGPEAAVKRARGRVAAILSPEGVLAQIIITLRTMAVRCRVTF